MIRQARSITVAAVIVAGALAGAGFPAIASAAPPSVEFSRNGGQSWSTTPPMSIFSAAKRLVPGDVVSENLLIRSLRSEPTLVQVSIVNAVVGDPSFDGAMTVEGADGTGMGLAPIRFSDISPCESVVPNRVLTAGQTVSVTLILRVSSSLAAREAQGASGKFDLALLMTDPGQSIAPNGCVGSPIVIPGSGPPSIAQSGAGLAYTGSAAVYPALVVAGLTLGMGWLFVFAARRQREKQS